MLVLVRVIVIDSSCKVPSSAVNPSLLDYDYEHRCAEHDELNAEFYSHV
ncbi:MAG: hypothetical protein V1736_14060 [Pseudomonadota bacterium]